MLKTLNPEPYGQSLSLSLLNPYFHVFRGSTYTPCKTGIWVGVFKWSNDRIGGVRAKVA